MSCRAEEIHTPQSLMVDGSLPAALHGGRYLLNGPGWIQIGDQIAHPFDGPGCLREVSFGPSGEASMRGRFVSTDAYRAEASAGCIVYRGLATNVKGGTLANLVATFRGSRNPANTTVVQWASHFLCGYEGGLPYSVDPESLDTIGLMGTLAIPRHLDAYSFMLAHMRVDTSRDRLVCLQVSGGPRSVQLV